MAIVLIKLYQCTLSWDHQWRFIVGGARVCRYWPSCSDYAIASLQRYGFWKGGMKVIVRLLRCNPFSCGGHDPVM